MQQNSKPKRSAGFGLVIGVAMGVIVALIFKKLALGLLLGIIVALLLYSAEKR
jgi:hypothetical protein